MTTSIPSTEAVLAEAVELLRGLRSEWNDESTLGLLRDKFALNEQLRRVRRWEPQPLLNSARGGIRRRT